MQHQYNHCSVKDNVNLFTVILENFLLLDKTNGFYHSEEDYVVIKYVARSILSSLHSVILTRFFI